MVSKAKFEPIGDVLSPETAFIQAANALDVAATMAIARQDVEGIQNVAALYIELGTRLMGPGPEEEEEEEEVDHEALERKIPLGFSPFVVPEIIPAETENEDE